MEISKSWFTESEGEPYFSRGKANRKYAFVNVNERLQKLFAMTGVEQFLVMYENIVAAEAALSF